MADQDVNIRFKLIDDASKTVQTISGRMESMKNGMKRVASETNESTKKMKSDFKGFSESVKDNWLGLISAYYTFKKIINFTYLGAQAKTIEDSFERMSNQFGINATNMRKQLEEISAYTANFSNIASGVTSLMSKGLNQETIVKLMQQARAEAKLFGQTTEEAFKSISDAVAGGYTRTLKMAYGITVDNSKAIENFALQTGMTKKTVEEFYESQAIANEVLKQSATHLKSAGLETISYSEQLQIFNSGMNDLKEKTGQAIMKIIQLIFKTNDLAVAFKKANSGLEKVSVYIQKTVIGWRSIFSLIEFFSKGIGTISATMSKPFEVFEEAMKEHRENLIKEMKELNQELDNLYSKDKTPVTLPSIDVSDETTNNIKSLSVMAENYKKEYDTILNEMKNNSLEALNEMYESQKLHTDNKIFLDNWYSEKKREIEEKNLKNHSLLYRNMVEITKVSINAMTDMVGNTLYGVFSGTFKGISSIIQSFKQAILKALADIIAKLLVMKALMASVGILSKIFPGAGTVLSTAMSLSGIGTKQIGTKRVAEDGLQYLHKGEEVVQAGQASASSIVINPTVVINTLSASEVQRNIGLITNAITQQILNSAPMLGAIKRRI